MKIEYASTGKVEMFAQVATEFMQAIFVLEPVSCVISDESDLRDFTDFGVLDTLPLWRRITAFYDIEQSDVGSERLVEIFFAIERRKYFQ